MGRTRYDDDQKREAVELALEYGKAEAARRTGISAGTIGSWCSREGLATVATERTKAATEAAKDRREQKREQLRTLLIEKAVDLVERMDEPHIDFRGKDANQVTFPKAPAQACQHYATSAAILLDKFRLEMGEVTGRTEFTGKEAALAVADELAERRKKSA